MTKNETLLLNALQELLAAVVQLEKEITRDNVNRLSDAQDAAQALITRLQP